MKPQVALTLLALGCLGVIMSMFMADPWWRLGMGSSFVLSMLPFFVLEMETE